MYVVTPKMIGLFKAKAITSPDVHKPGRPQIPCLGGLVVITGLMAGYMMGALLCGVDRYSIAMFMLTILLLGVIGLIDYIIGLRHRTKVLLCLFAGLPLALTFTGETVLHTPLGEIELGVLYYMGIPLVIAASANLTNMLAGYNGLEAGLGSVIAATMLASAIMMRQQDTAVMMAVLLGSLLAFLFYNWYPARMFLSDVGTLSIGAVVAVAAITGSMKLPFLMCIIPYTIDFFMKMSIKFRGRTKYGDARINSDGTLDPPTYPSLPHVFLKRKKLNEQGLVKIMLIFEAMFCAIALAYVVARAIQFGLW